MWQPDLKRAGQAVQTAFYSEDGYEGQARSALELSGALSEIKRLEARVSQLESELLTERFF